MTVMSNCGVIVYNMFGVQFLALLLSVVLLSSGNDTHVGREALMVNDDLIQTAYSPLQIRSVRYIQ